MPLMTLNSRQR